MAGGTSAPRFLEDPRADGRTGSGSGSNAAGAAACAEAMPIVASGSRSPPSSDGGTFPARKRPAPRASHVALRAGAVGLMHIACSAALILFNKYLMHRDRFPFAACLTTMHMLAAFLLSAALRQVAPQLFPSAGAVLGGGGVERLRGTPKPQPWPPLRGLWPFVPVGVCCAASVVSANSAYRYASVSFLQMVKESVVLWVYLLTVLVGAEPLRLRYLAVLGFVTCSAALAVCGEVHFMWAGLLLQLFSSIAQASQAVFMGSLMTQLRGPKVDPLTMVLGSAPVVLCVLLPVNFALWEGEIAKRLLLWWPVLAANALAAFALQVVNAVTIRELSATGLALAAVLKDLAIVGSAAAVLHESLTRSQALGFAGAVGGIALYSAMKLRPPAPAAPQPEAPPPA